MSLSRAGLLAAAAAAVPQVCFLSEGSAFEYFQDNKRISLLSRFSCRLWEEKTFVLGGVFSRLRLTSSVIAGGKGDGGAQQTWRLRCCG